MTGDPKDSAIGRLVRPSEAVLAAMGRRQNIFGAMDDALQAVVTPRDPGGLSHSERAALACRIAHLHANVKLAAHFRSLVDDSDFLAVCEPRFHGGDDRRAKAVLAFTDLVATHPRDAQAADVSGLVEAGLAEADTVRLAELIAFMAFMIRVADGLLLMEQGE